MRLDAHIVADFCHQLGRQISQLIMAQGGETTLGA